MVTSFLAIEGTCWPVFYPNGRMGVSKSKKQKMGQLFLSDDTSEFSDPEAIAQNDICLNNRCIMHLLTISTEDPLFHTILK
jgi:hypothetical protein